MNDCNVIRKKTLSYSFNQLPHRGIQNLHPYVPGKSIEELAQEQGIIDIIKLASNENPLGCSTLVQEALSHLSSRQIAAYPAPQFHPLKNKLSNKLSIENSQLTLCNGSDLLFTLLLMLFGLHNGKHMLTHDKAFSTYAIQAETLGIPVVTTPLLSGWQVDIAAIIQACTPKTGIIFLANPNNPTGILIPRKSIAALLEAIPHHIIIVIDEAYYEYANAYEDYSALPLLEKHPNLIITRTFSKAYGLAGLRLGFSISHSDISALLHKVMLPFTVNQAALAAAFAALDDVAFLEETLRITQEGMLQLTDGLKAFPVSFLPSYCNFITIDCHQPAQNIYEALLKKGIIVRPLNAYRLPQHLRVTVGTNAQNNRFLKALEHILPIGAINE